MNYWRVFALLLGSYAIGGIIFPRGSLLAGLVAGVSMGAAILYYQHRGWIAG